MKWKKARFRGIQLIAISNSLWTMSHQPASQQISPLLVLSNPSIILIFHQAFGIRNLPQKLQLKVIYRAFAKVRMMLFLGLKKLRSKMINWSQKYLAGYLKSKCQDFKKKNLTTNSSIILSRHPKHQILPLVLSLKAFCNSQNQERKNVSIIEQDFS